MKKLMMCREALCILVLLSCCPAFSQAAATGATAIPFVGCRSGGQLGPEDAPAGKDMELSVPAWEAQRLAYYRAERGVGVLGPRGWYCFGTYGSNGEELYVSPSPINPDDLLSTRWKGFHGPAIEISYNYGGTSGRFAVANVIARVFPARRAFVRKVVADERKVGMPGTTFPDGPYKRDMLKYRSRDIVEYQTPPNADGLGTHSWLRKNGYEIRGVAILTGSEPDLIQLSARLPSDTKDLTPFIIEQTEREAARLDKGSE